MCILYLCCAMLVQMSLPTFLICQLFNGSWIVSFWNSASSLFLLWHTMESFSMKSAITSLSWMRDCFTHMNETIQITFREKRLDWHCKMPLFWQCKQSIRKGQRGERCCHSIRRWRGQLYTVRSNRHWPKKGCQCPRAQHDKAKEQWFQWERELQESNESLIELKDEWEWF